MCLSPHWLLWFWVSNHIIESLWVQHSFHIQKTLFHRSSPGCSCNLWNFASKMFPESWMRGYVIDVPFRNENSTVTYPLHFGQLCIPVIAFAYYRKNLLWWWVETALTHKDKYLEGGWKQKWQQTGSSVFSSRIHDFSSYRVLYRFTVSSMSYFQLSGLLVQAASYWLPPRY